MYPSEEMSITQHCWYSHTGSTPALTSSGIHRPRSFSAAHTSGTGARKASGQRFTGANAQAIRAAWSSPAAIGTRMRTRAGLLAGIVDDPGDLAAEVGPLHDAVHEPRLLQELGTLEALGQLLADRLL